MSNIIDIGDAATTIGEHLRDAIKDKIMEPIEPPNAPSTIKKKGFDHPLMDTGAYYDAVEARITIYPDSAEVEVGVFDQQVAWYVAINEEGTKDGKIPERPALRETWDEQIQELGDDLEDTLGDAIETWWENA